MNRHFVLSIVVAAGLFVISSTDAFARGDWNHGGRHNGPEYDNRYDNGPATNRDLTPEQQKALDTTIKNYEARIVPLQDKIAAKRLELDALARNPNAKSEDISALAKETAQAQADLRKELRAMDDAMQGQLGTSFRHNGMGNGMGYGMGNGMGNGMNRNENGYGHRGSRGHGGHGGHGGGNYGNNGNYGGHGGHGNGCTGGTGCPWL